jgi:ubiquinone/menaquinone biosynthesis C-methylase UbiE
VTARIDYDEQQYAVYVEGRDLTPALAALWSGVFRRYLDRYIGHDARPAILDLGGGTGMYARLLADEFDAKVSCVEPSARMREVAERTNPHPRVDYVAGSAEEIPLADGSCDFALMSDVIHHVADRDRCAAELRRVIRRGGLLLVRGTLAESLPRVHHFVYFPTALPIAQRQFPAVAEVVSLFAGHGFEHVASETVEQETAPSLPVYYERIKRRAISTLELISNADFAAGLAQLREAAQRAPANEVVIEPINVVALRRR